jgi:hypothetical protein
LRFDLLPIDFCDPTLLLGRVNNPPVNDQSSFLIQFIRVIAVQGDVQAVAQVNLLAREIADGAHSIQADSALGIGIMKIGVNQWQLHFGSIKSSSLWQD